MDGVTMDGVNMDGVNMASVHMAGVMLDVGCQHGHSLACCKPGLHSLEASELPVPFLDVSLPVGLFPPPHASQIWLLKTAQHPFSRLMNELVFFKYQLGQRKISNVRHKVFVRNLAPCC